MEVFYGDDRFYTRDSLVSEGAAGKPGFGFQAFVGQGAVGIGYIPGFRQDMVGVCVGMESAAAISCATDLTVLFVHGPEQLEQAAEWAYLQYMDAKIVIFADYDPDNDFHALRAAREAAMANEGTVAVPNRDEVCTNFADLMNYRGPNGLIMCLNNALAPTDFDVPPAPQDC